MKTVQYILKVAIVQPQIDLMTSNIFLGKRTSICYEENYPSLKGTVFLQRKMNGVLFLNKCIAFLAFVKATSH